MQSEQCSLIPKQMLAKIFFVNHKHTVWPVIVWFLNNVIVWFLFNESKASAASKIKYFPTL